MPIIVFGLFAMLLYKMAIWFPDTCGKFLVMYLGILIGLPVLTIIVKLIVGNDEEAE